MNRGVRGGVHRCRGGVPVDGAGRRLDKWARGPAVLVRPVQPRDGRRGGVVLNPCQAGGGCVSAAGCGRVMDRRCIGDRVHGDHGTDCGVMMRRGCGRCREEGEGRNLKVGLLVR